MTSVNADGFPTHMTPKSAQEIGSDFEVVDESWLTERVSAPWKKDGGVQYVESGRQALALMSDVLKTRGASHLLAPAYYCESMIEPFIRGGWRIELSDVDAELRCVPTTPPSVDSNALVVLSAAYFGVPEREDWTSFLREQQSLGATVVSDETHRPFGQGWRDADHRFASLRKTLPVPDGAFVSGLPACDLSEGGPVAELRLGAMRTKLATLKDGLYRGHRERFHEAEALTESRTQPTAMSGVSLQLLDRMDYARLRARRADNAIALANSLCGVDIEIVHREWLKVGLSHLLLRSRKAHQLRRWLAAKGVFCPIHWPEPDSIFPRLGTWPQNLLSVPIDHRYDGEDMRRVAALIVEWSSHADERD
jgi:hypothetical protein